MSLITGSNVHRLSPLTLFPYVVSGFETTHTHRQFASNGLQLSTSLVWLEQTITLYRNSRVETWELLQPTMSNDLRSGSRWGEHYCRWTPLPYLEEMHQPSATFIQPYATFVQSNWQLLHVIAMHFIAIKRFSTCWPSEMTTTVRTNLPCVGIHTCVIFKTFHLMKWPFFISFKTTLLWSAESCWDVATFEKSRCDDNVKQQSNTEMQWSGRRQHKILLTIQQSVHPSHFPPLIY